jgi:hypothetical protein
MLLHASQALADGSGRLIVHMIAAAAKIHAGPCWALPALYLSPSPALF